MDFLNRIYLDNSIKNYCIVFGTILLVLVFKRYFSRYLATLFFRIINRIWKNIDKKSFVDLVVEPLEWFLLLLIAVFAIDKLNFPEEWKYNIYGHSTEQILTKVGIGVIIISFTNLLLRTIDFIAVVLKQNPTFSNNKADNQLVVFFRDFLKVIIGIVGLLLLIKACFNQPIGNLLTSLSIVGAVVALAAKESLENLIASFIIFFDKPFATGDTLKVNNVTGTVEKIGLRSTRIRTADKTLVTVPNKQMVDSVVDNWSMRTHRRAEVKLELSAKTTAAETQQCIDAIKKLLQSKTDQFTSSSVYLTELNKNGIVLTVEYFTQPITLDQFNSIKETIGLALKKLLEENNIEMSSVNNIGITLTNTDRGE
jgi:MscS family membrane protein